MTSCQASADIQPVCLGGSVQEKWATRIDGSQGKNSVKNDPIFTRKHLPQMEKKENVIGFGWVVYVCMCWERMQNGMAE